MICMWKSKCTCILMSCFNIQEVECAWVWSIDRVPGDMDACTTCVGDGEYSGSADTS